MKKTILIVCMLCGISAFSADRPTAVFIAIDDLRPELECYAGPQVKSPTLDKRATQSVRFSRTYCQVAVCGAARASLMAGKLEYVETVATMKTHLAARKKQAAGAKAPGKPVTIQNPKKKK